MNWVSPVSVVWFEQTRSALEQYLQQKMQSFANESNELHNAMSYSILSAGKRLRAMLVFAAGHAVNTAQHQLMDAACAVEAMHAYSLVHDDLPCMDNDILRRGMPTCHVRFGQAIALLAGDALQTTAFQWLAESEQGAPAVRLAQIRALAHASGAQGMACGQAIDLVHVGKLMTAQELQFMHARKTGDLIKACVRLGYLSQPDLGFAPQNGLEAYADHLGFAYQIMDDILDVESSSDVLGKTQGKDALQKKPTIVSLMGLHEAKILLAQLKNKALQACDCFTESQREPLVALIELITNRKS